MWKISRSRTLTLFGWMVKAAMGAAGELATNVLFSLFNSGYSVSGRW